MPTPTIERRVRQPLLDRLTDFAPGELADQRAEWEASAREFRESVRRDLEWLLNTRRIAEPAPDQYAELQRSLYGYGVPDVTSLSLDAPAARTRLARQVEEAIRLFEPRLASVRVKVAEATDPRRGGFRLTIEAQLRMEPSPERVLFDTAVDGASGKFLLDVG
jgi:type VI secretion system protein ImpF